MRKSVKRQRQVAAIVMWTIFAAAGVPHVFAAADSDRRSEGAAEAQAAEPARWEYCELEFLRGTSPWFPASASGAGGDRVQWSSATASVDARSWRDLAAKMKIDVPDKTASAKLVVLDGLGAQGWELVSATAPTGQAAPSSTWTFRRKAK